MFTTLSTGGVLPGVASVPSGATISTTGLAVGNYVWVATYSGTGSGYPKAPLAVGASAPYNIQIVTGGPWYTCEPFAVTAATGVPQFSLGLLPLLALALPAMLLLRARLGKIRAS